jgi:MFS family permease
MGLAFVPVTISAVAGVAPQEAGLASGLVNTARLFGGALGLAVLAALATARTNTDLHHAFSNGAALTDGFQLAFAVAAGIALVGAAVAAFGLPRAPSRAAQTQAQPETESLGGDRAPVAAESVH